MNTLKTLPQFAEGHPGFTVRKLRWIDQRSRHDAESEYSKFAPAFVRVGRSVFIDEPKFMAIATGEGVSTT